MLPDPNKLFLEEGNLDCNFLHSIKVTFVTWRRFETVRFFFVFVLLCWWETKGSRSETNQLKLNQNQYLIEERYTVETSYFICNQLC